MDNYVKPSSDIFIKYLLGSEKNKDLLISFINAVFEDSGFSKITEVEIKNPFNIKNFSIDKESILDIKAADENGRQFDIEVQSTGNERFINRSLYYWARLYSGQLKEAERYSTLKPTVCINILDFEVFKEMKKSHNCFLLCEKSNPEYVLTDHILLHYLELPKVTKKDIKMKLYKWLYYLKIEGKEDDTLKILLRDDMDFQKAHKNYVRFTEDEQLRDIYEARMKWERDRNSDLAEAEEKGMEKGMEKGLKQGLEEKQGLLIRLLSKKFKLTEKDQLKIKSVDDREKLDDAIEEIFFAETKQDVLKLLD
jgi:predicted transposase/invertase (TIGR01784 family)